MAVLEVVLVVTGLWFMLTLGALALASGIGAAAAAADRNERRLLRVRSSNGARGVRPGLRTRR